MSLFHYDLDRAPAFPAAQRVRIEGRTQLLDLPALTLEGLPTVAFPAVAQGLGRAALRLRHGVGSTAPRAADRLPLQPRWDLDPHAADTGDEQKIEQTVEQVERIASEVLPKVKGLVGRGSSRA